MKRPRQAPTRRWKRSRGILVMGANIFMSSVHVGITRLATRRLQKSRRQTE